MKKIFYIIMIILLSSCSIGNYEIKKIQKEKIEKVSNSELKEEIENLKEEMAEIRRLKEKEIKIKEKETEKKERKLTKEELELKLLEIENKKLEVENKKLDIDTTKKESDIKMIDSTHCLLDSCLYKKNIEIENFGKINKILDIGEKIISFIGDDNCFVGKNLKENKNCKIASEITKSKTFFKKILSLGEKTEIIYINNFLDFYIKTIYSKTSTKYSILQKIYDKNGKILEKSKVNKVFLKKYNLLEDNIKIANIDYKLYSNIEKIDVLLDSKNTIIFDDQNYINSKLISLKLLDLALEKKKIYKNYIFSINKNKGIYFMYSNNLNQSEKIINLGLDKKWLEQNIDKEGNFLDKELTQKIVGYYNKKDSKTKLYNKNNKIVLSISGEDFPIFNLKKFDEKGNYLLFLNNGYLIK